MSDNSQHKVEALERFADLAGTRGCYTPSQVGSCKSAMNLALSRVGDEAAQKKYRSEKTIAEFLAEAAKLLERHGAETNTKSSSIKVYKARAKKLADDYIRWNGGNFLEWKDELEKKKPSGSSKRAKKNPVRSEVRGPEEDTHDIPPAGSAKHPLLLPGGMTAALVMPEEATKGNIEMVWKQLELLRKKLDLEADLRASFDTDDKTTKGGDSADKA